MEQLTSDSLAGQIGEWIAEFSDLTDNDVPSADRLAVFISRRFVDANIQQVTDPDDVVRVVEEGQTKKLQIVGEIHHGPMPFADCRWVNPWVDMQMPQQFTWNMLRDMVHADDQQKLAAIQERLQTRNAPETEFSDPS